MQMNESLATYILNGIKPDDKLSNHDKKLILDLGKKFPKLKKRINEILPQIVSAPIELTQEQASVVLGLYGYMDGRPGTPEEIMLQKRLLRSFPLLREDE